MKIVMTLMVRNEADVVRPMLEHHLAQGIDRFIITDNASDDGTLEILREFERRGLADVVVDERHQKQQSEVVTRMAREASVEHGADWVINADADEFWVAADRERTVRQVLETTPKAFRSFVVPVIDMTGAPARRGTGLSRLVFRDRRTREQLWRVGLLAHSTSDAIHIGDPAVVVAQGNHAVSIESLGAPSAADGLEVLHLPWRSWEQFSRKVEQSGRAYASNSRAVPSPNHHGMRDYRRLLDGSLLGFYVARHPAPTDIDALVGAGELELDERLAQTLRDEVPDEPLDPAEASAALDRATPMLELESRALTAEARIPVLEEQNQALRSEAESLRVHLHHVEEAYASVVNRRIVRWTDVAVERLRGARRRR